ncbi:GntR family transcriptional regulator [Aquitalea sp. LB_tupeE]|uniref:GntR family transcriptional regulator n=1 Tax=Aquitalea sp. LB_tupeE TaxID=2748078 RepID=UPI0015B7EC0F|nr:GntR family transcriptional regulator [Aquitalea sp. LB_tupeE]NWK76653.1 GntR family transcriptional regulator [Aquitalea sp. LB_tupeE]
MTIPPLLTSVLPVNQQIFRLLRQDIVTARIPPGMLLSEKEISSRFAVSRQPVREAFIKLAEAGLVQILPQRGTLVVKISVSQVAEGSFIRQAVECAVARRLAVQINQGQLLTLEHNLQQQQLAAQTGQADVFLQLDDAFHQLLAQFATCALAWQTIESIKATMDRVRFLSLDAVSPPELLIEQHAQIVSALQARDADASEAAMAAHLQEIGRSVLEVARHNQDWFIN